MTVPLEEAPRVDMAISLSEQEPLQFSDLNPICDYLSRLVSLLLATQQDTIAKLFLSDKSQEELARFVANASPSAIYISKVRTSNASDEDASLDTPQAFPIVWKYEVSQHLPYRPDIHSIIAVIKQSRPVDVELSLEDQLQAIHLRGPANRPTAPVFRPEGADGIDSELQDTEANSSTTITPYMAMHSLLHLAVSPYFDAYVASKSRKHGETPSANATKDSDAKMGVPMAKKKLAELELSLVHLQQNVEIPDIHLVVHPIIQRAVDNAQGRRASPEDIDPAQLSDSSFLNKLQSEVNSWIKEIQNVTKLNRDVASGTASQEINFWLSMEKALEDIEAQLRSEPITLTLDILKHAKRFHATVSFLADTGLKEATDIVFKYNQLMKDFPLNELLAATDLDKIQSSLDLIFGHINRKLKISPYPVRRALPLVEAISRDFNEQLLKVLGASRLMYMEYESFEKIMQKATNAFQTWDDLMKEFTNVAREVTRKRSEKFLPIKINPAHAALQERISYLIVFRKQHHQLSVMTSGDSIGLDSKITSNGSSAITLPDIDMEYEVKTAYESLKSVDVLDTSTEGALNWAASETAYNERITRVENVIISRLRYRLGTAKNAAESFRVFSKFNSLFVRPKIRGAVQEFQTTLIDQVKDDIRSLHEKYKTKYRSSQAYLLAQLRDLPPIAGAIIWARQIERQLTTYMQRVQDVLGSGWEYYADGQKLASESASFRRKLDTRPVYEAWLLEISRRELQIHGLIFDIYKNRSEQGRFQLAVNFDPQIITLFKEVRNLIWAGFQVPHSISNVAKDAKRAFPLAVSLTQSVRTYTQTVDKISSNPGVAQLLAEYRSNAHTKIEEGFSIRWEHFVSFDTHRSYLAQTSNSNSREPGALVKHNTYVRELANVISILQDRTEDALEMYEGILAIIDDLAVCTYSTQAFSERLSQIQKTIDKLNLEGYSNLDAWVIDIDERVQVVLAERLSSVVELWCSRFTLVVESDGDLSPAKAEWSSTTKRPKNNREHEGDSSLKLPVYHHEIRIRNQVIFLDPPIEHARANWYSALQQWLGVVCGLKRLQSSRYEIGLKIQHTSIEESHYTGLLERLSNTTLEKPFGLVEVKLQEITTYVNKWLQFQSLWDLEAEYVYNRLGDSLASWQQLLLEIRKSRATFDNSEIQRDFGVAVIRYDQVQSKVNARYDAWQRDILIRFGSKLGATMKETYSAILKSRRELEVHSIEGSSTNQAVNFITFVQDLKRKVEKWSPVIEIFANGQRTLERQRFQFPSDWLYADQVEGEFEALREILQRKNTSIQEQLAGLQVKIQAEDKIIQNRIDETISSWEETKPIQGSLRASEAIKTITTFSDKVQKLQEDYENVCRAKEALSLDLIRDNKLEPVIEEIRDLQAVWTALSGIWSQIYELRDTPWSSVQSRKLRQQLDGLLASTRDMPSRMRQYAAFEYVQDNLRQLLKSNSLISDLKSEALRERHWRQLYKSLKVSGHYSQTQMTLGAVWDLDLKRNENAIKEVITQAQGEMALEEFLKQVKETWTSYSLELVNYQNKTRLIRGWDDLFAKCTEHLNSLTAMKMSPYYKVFEEEASSWEDKLNRVHVLFDVWIDVQRQWVYLEGIFSGSADIKRLLPTESNRFNVINSEFLTVMKKVLKSPFVLDVLNISGVQKSLERLADLLAKIQKALGEYLERERSSCPRFYFVGDEDLLEIIGNSQDIFRVLKHLKKMFAGVSSLLFDSETAQIEGMASKEGEEVRFATPIVLKENPRVNDWLKKLESEMKLALARNLSEAYLDLDAFFTSVETLTSSALLHWIDTYPAQIVVLATQIKWTSMIENGIEKKDIDLPSALSTIATGLDILADAVLTDLSPIKRRKCEHLITELVHQRDVTRRLHAENTESTKSFSWLYHMRYYLDLSEPDPLKQLTIHMSEAIFHYGFEYFGVPDRLVQTPLTDRCFLTLTQALASRLGGAPFGPAGTGKTESVKALGVALGRFVLVFCCDETFDFQAMGRIFIGLCQVGAWGCFDEFNRLEERILSAVSQQIQSIQLGLRAASEDSSTEVELVGRRIKINTDTGIFVTTNPGYAGRSNLPDNLKKLFRNVSMTRPDLELIAQVMLFSQGFRTAEILASKVVPFFQLCDEQLSKQPHYDFGLRALKAVLISAGHLKRSQQQLTDDSKSSDVNANIENLEQEIVIQSVSETIAPKLIADDIPLLTSLLSDVFPGIDYRPVPLTELQKHIEAICKERHLQPTEQWLQKVLQLYKIQIIQHGVMLVGPAATGKTQAWSVLLEALERLTRIEGVSYVIDPKAMSKEAIYGTLDQTTREWTDGLFTNILRKIVDSVRGENMKCHWIIFDGDVDPEWVENLNSVLDDNKLLTLPNGERLNLPPNVRIIFEVENLKYATLATVSRCGMIWFSESTVNRDMIMSNYLSMLRTVPLDAVDDEFAADLAAKRAVGDNGVVESSHNLGVQYSVAQIIEPHFAEDGLVKEALLFAEKVEHIMDFTESRALETFFSLINKSVRNILEYNAQHQDFPLSGDKLTAYINKRLLLGIVWAFTGDSKLDVRKQMGEYLRKYSEIEFPPIGDEGSIIDFDVSINSADWEPWQNSVQSIEIETHAVSSADVVVPTIDTARHEDVLYSWLSEHKPLILCGPPGSGKTMTLFSALRKLNDMEVIGLNFSSATTPELILKTFDQYCEYKKTPNGVTLSPVQIGRWIVVFCDEINLPATDKYGTQRVISFMRQLIEKGGYWRTSDKTWVKLERIQFVGACNPPTDPGRVPLSQRFLRHAPLVLVDYPGEISMKQIYGTFNRALLKVVPTLRAYAEPLTNAMVDFYLKSQRRFTSDIQAHYVYSPRELTRWARGIYESLKPMDSLSLEGLIRIWAHEALRLFQDRLVTEEERLWTDETLDETAKVHFPTMEYDEALKRPIMFSNWTTKGYVSVDREVLREFTKARLKVFYEEELDVPLVLFNDVLDHVLRIDRVFRQVQGHLLLIGVSGSGKTTLSRFVAWMNGLSVFQVKVHNRYTAADFDEDLRTVLRRAGCKAEKICFIMDESNCLDSGFLERMNTLLANAEVPGLFEGDEHAALMTACKEGAQRDGLLLDSHEELYRWFTQQVAKNLHVVFTMNPPEKGLASRAATSPALFNRCVLDWFGNWSDQAFYQVGMEFTRTLDLDTPNYAAPINFPAAYRQLSLPPTHRTAVVNALCHVHISMTSLSTRLQKRQGRSIHVTPRHYLDFISHYVKLFNEKRDDLEEQQRHLNVGLDKLRSTVIQVEELRVSLAVKRTQLENKNVEANEKLQRMVSDQQEAEQQKSASIGVQASLEKQEREIEERRTKVHADLRAAEPAVHEAQSSVSNIKKQHLSEVRTMANPPEAVKATMEAVCTLLGHRLESWKTVQGIIRRDDFIASIVNYDTDRQMTRSLREKMKKEYLSKKLFNFETVNRASKACGPLVQWVIAQVNFSEILDRVGPLREEVDQLEHQAEVTKQEADTIVTMIKELEGRIARFKEEYAALISETQLIKSEMERVQTRVDRSIKLLESLGSEKERWEETSRTFDTQMSTIAGDVLLSAAFLAYGGYFDQRYREDMWRILGQHLSDSAINFKQELSLPEYLSSADDRLSWQSKSLPADDLCTENAIILKRYDRYPLIIDPSGQASTFITNEYKDRKIVVTSFLDKSFIKNLESALRFGTPLLIHDVERLDPILNPVLNKELRKAGGRVLIRLGNQDIDFSPAFTMFLSTRDPSVEFPPDICSRVTFVNFTMTRGSLQSQSLNQVLKVERPDTDRKRTDLLKLQGEFKLRLRHLEKSLLQALNESSSNILDDDKVIDTLESLKRETMEVSVKVEDTEKVMQEIDAVTSIYAPLAQACSSIYFVLDQLSLLNRFYQFSLRYFLDIFEYLLFQSPAVKKISDPHERLVALTENIFLLTFKRTSRSLLHDDHITLALLLAQIKWKGEDPEIDSEFESFLDAVDNVARPDQINIEEPDYLNTVQIQQLKILSRNNAFKELVEDMNSNQEPWKAFLQSEQAENCVPKFWDSSLPALLQHIRRLFLVKSFRPDRLLYVASQFASSAFGNGLLYDIEYDLADIVSKEVNASTPISLCSVPGFDASYRIENLIKESQSRCTSVAMGSPEGFALADQALANATRSGTWVLLKNVHLAPGWLAELEKRLQTQTAHADFRLFLTMETNPKIPVNILRQSRIIMAEPAPGIRANMLDSLNSINSTQLSTGPNEKKRLLFLLSFLHAVLIERLRFCPLGFSKTYEFNESDYEAGKNVIDYWISHAARGRSNLDPLNIPFEAIRTLLKETCYGGKIDQATDQRVLDSFIDSLFHTGVYDIGFPLAQALNETSLLEAPEGNSWDVFIDWTKNLPERDPLSFLALPAASEEVVATEQGNMLLSKLRKMKSLENDDDLALDTTKDNTDTAAQPLWMRQLQQNVQGFLKSLPEKLKTPEYNEESIQDPLYRYFTREANVIGKLLQTVRRDLESVSTACDGGRQTNHIRTLMGTLSHGGVPENWRVYKIRAGVSIAYFINDFRRRLDQLVNIIADGCKGRKVWLGGLCFPAGYLTATRQSEAHRTGKSVEQLEFQLSVGSDDDDGFCIEDLSLESANMEHGRLFANEGAKTLLPSCTIKWAHVGSLPDNDGKIFKTPLYLDSSRLDLLVMVDLPVMDSLRHHIQRGVALVAHV